MKKGAQIILAGRVSDPGLALGPCIYEFDWNFPACVVVCNEVSGVTEELVSLCDEHVEIPMQGVKQSLNVSVAAGIIGYEILRYYNMYKQIRKK